MHLTGWFAASKPASGPGRFGRTGGRLMAQVVAYLCGVWFWLTRRWRIDVYCAAAETLELAHAYLARDFAAHASTRDRGVLSPQQNEALALLQAHALQTYVNAMRLAKLDECCRFVAKEMRELNRPTVSVAPRPAVVVLRPAPLAIRVRFASNRVLRFSLSRPSWVTRLSWITRPAWITSVARFLSAETSGLLWSRWQIGTWRLRPVADTALAAKPAERPLKAA